MADGDDVRLRRCGWCGEDEDYVRYHDEEWGIATHDDDALFERLVLEGMQAGLSWLTVLKKRARMREQFFSFDMRRLAGAGQPQIEAWLQDAGLIRHRGKLEAMVGNARIALTIDGFGEWLWTFAPPLDQVATYHHRDKVPAVTAESTHMSKMLKKAGFRFVGPTICYAFMQSVGMVNDHLVDCWRYQHCHRSLET